MFEMSQEVDNLDVSKESEEVKMAKAEALFQTFTAAQKNIRNLPKSSFRGFYRQIWGGFRLEIIDMDKFGAQGFDDAGCAGFIEVKKRNNLNSEQ